MLNHLERFIFDSGSSEKSSLPLKPGKRSDPTYGLDRMFPNNAVVFRRLLEPGAVRVLPGGGED